MKTYGFWCLTCGIFEQTIIRKLRNGNFIIRCPKCQRMHEIAKSGYSTPYKEA